MGRGIFWVGGSRWPYLWVGGGEWGWLEVYFE